jgi:hypothetical protein
MHVLWIEHVWSFLILDFPPISILDGCADDIGKGDLLF